jgi:phytoene synthase
VDRAFAATVARHAVPRALPEALLEGLAWDAEGRAYETLHDLQAYAARVAGAVGAMMAVLMGARDEHVLARACDLGVAMQLSNIARDVGEDARMGRVYLPRAWLRAEGIDAEAFLAAPAFTPALGRVVQRLLAEAETLYRRSEAGIAMLPLGCQPGIGAARRIYAAIGHQVRDAGGDSVSRRAVVTGRRKLALLARSLPPFMARRKDLAEPPLAATRYLVAAVAATPPPPPGPAAIWDLARRLDGALTVASRMHQRDMVARQSNRAR